MISSIWHYQHSPHHDSSPGAPTHHSEPEPLIRGKSTPLGCRKQSASYNFHVSYQRSAGKRSARWGGSGRAFTSISIGATEQSRRLTERADNLSARREGCNGEAAPHPILTPLCSPGYTPRRIVLQAHRNDVVKRLCITPSVCQDISIQEVAIRFGLKHPPFPDNAEK
jgi:hypothetical protein